MVLTRRLLIIVVRILHDYNVRYNVPTKQLNLQIIHNTTAFYLQFKFTNV